MAKFHLPSLEEGQQKIWEERDIFKKVLAKESPRGNFVFFEGPPTANGKPGIHHLLTRTFKDVILRFRTMQGYHIDRKAGWDTHGLPVELEVEKQLGFTKKQDIEAYGIAAFNAKCRESVWKYLDLWQKSTTRVAFWIDLEDPYVTYRNEFVESLWWVLKEFDRKGLLYQGYRVTPHCPRCVTSLSSHELAQGYKDTEDPSVFVKFPIDVAAKKYFLVWTTTPWTLPGNVALAVGAKVDYVEVKVAETGERLILAKERLSVLGGAYDIVGEMKGEKLVSSAYVPLYPMVNDSTPRKENAYKVYAADFVSTADGTGIVHIAPAFGEDDAKLGEAAQLPTLLTVDQTGFITVDVPGKGKFFKKADDIIKEELVSRGLMYQSGTITHSYPFCWRCGTPILYYAKTSWYARMSSLRNKLVANNEQVHWVPEHIREGRFGEWLREVKDWALSRERYWGTPLPIWHCENCKKHSVVGSLAEMDAMSRPKNRYFLQRHGESVSNATDTVSSWPETKPFPLTAKGREQVAESAKKLKSEGVEMIFASDLLRTTETAAIIAAELGIPASEIRYDARLREIDTGTFNGRPIKEYEDARGDRMSRFDATSDGCESLREVRRRMVSFVKELDAQYSGKKIVIVSHGDPLWLLQTGFEGLTDRQTLDWPHYNHVGTYNEMTLKNAPRDENGNMDVHRPYIDEVILACPHCKNGSMKRIPDVCDVWFDSGAMPFAQWHYPFENKERIDTATNFPADFISEAIDQTRGWFYTLLAVSTALGYDKPPYKNVICLGHVLDAKGQKMSKSKGNVVDPWVMIDKYGADAIRYFFATVNQPGEPKRFDEKDLDEVTKKVFLILWNVLTFYKMYAAEEEAPAAPPSSTNILDRWILSELARLVGSMTAKLEAYEVVDSCRLIGEFVNALSTWYLRRSRDRFKADPETQKMAVQTLGFVLRTLAKVMAPFTPFLADALYGELGGKGSVHLDEWPGPLVADGVISSDDGLRQAMDTVRNAASSGLEERAKAGIPVRQVLGRAAVSAPVDGEQWMCEILQDELNIEAVEWKKAEGNLSVALDTNLTPELKRKGAVREIVRHINDLRKGAGLSIKDRVVVRYATDSEFWRAVVSEYGAPIMKDVLSTGLEFGREDLPNAKEIDVDGQRMWVGIKKV